jgi:hypothetical protein
VPNALGSALAGVAIPAAAQNAIAAQNNTFLITNGLRISRYPSLRASSGSLMPRAERSDADADEKPCVVAVQTTLLHHVIRDVARGSTAIEFIADLVSGDDRGLHGREGNAPRIQRIHEIAVDGVSVCGRACDPREAKQRNRLGKAGQ